MAHCEITQYADSDQVIGDAIDTEPDLCLLTPAAKLSAYWQSLADPPSEADQATALRLLADLQARTDLPIADEIGQLLA